jgi:hypothetical protein
MSTLPNIFPAVNNDSFRGGEAKEFSATTGKGGESFDHLMARALSPSASKINASDESNQSVKNISHGSEKTDDAQTSKSFSATSLVKNLADAETAGGNFSVQPKKSKSSPQTSETIHAKKSSDQSSAKSDPQIPTSSAAVNPETLPVQIPTPIVALDATNVKAATDASVTGAVIAVVSNAAGILTALPEVKKTSTGGAKNPGANVLQNQPGISATLINKADDQEKIKFAAEVLATGKSNAIDSKIAGLTPTSTPTVSPISSTADDGKGDLKAGKTAAEMAADFSRPEFSAPSDLAAKISTPAQSISDGTPAAQQDALMAGADKTNKTAALTGKFLPGNVASVAGENNLPPRAEQISATVTSGATVQTSVQNSSATLTLSAADVVENSAAVDLRAQALERTHDLVALHAMRLSDTGNDSLQVVIKPGAGTQLSLELRQRGDGVEAQAVLQQGDFKHLNQHWSGLQQQLEQRGIKLAALTSENNFAGGGNGFFQPKQNSPAEADSFSGGTLVAAATVNGVTAQTSAHRGWETWA